MQEIVVQSIERKETKNGKSFFLVKAEDGSQFSSFDTRLDKVGAGTRLRIEVEVKGGYNNLKKFEVMGEVKPAVSSSSFERVHFEEHFRLKLTAQLWAAGKLADDSPPVTRLLEWLMACPPEPQRRWEEEVTSSKKKEESSSLDIDWALGKIKMLAERGIESWQEVNLLVWFKRTYRVDAATVAEGMAKLEKGQASHFRRMIEVALEPPTRGGKVA